MDEINQKKPMAFKKPVLVGKVGRLPHKVLDKKTPEENKVAENAMDLSYDEFIKANANVNANVTEVAPPQHATESAISLSYKEPDWSGLPQSSVDYVFEVLKSGVIVEKVNLMEKPYWVFGRLTSSDIYMAHPTISRYHAVLQYRAQAIENQPIGFYLYDLGSTHGTFLNKNRLISKVYARVQVGHMIKLGCSTRSFLLTGPEEDSENESELTVTELKQKRTEDLLQREEAKKLAIQQEEAEKEKQQKKDEERGIDWGMGEDADEETDLSVNPFAQTNNEELYIDDPKKALRGFMEREGHNLEYDCKEEGFGQFLCKVELPIDDERGRSIVAEVLHKGKKKEAVVQCALEACRILDRHGLLRAAMHESRKRKTKNWEENDYYDSDDDTFLDRTGAIEKKREKRMNVKGSQEPETYQSLLDKERSIYLQIVSIEKQLAAKRRYDSRQNSSQSEEDPLDSYMKELKDSKLDGQTISKLKTQLLQLKQEHMNVIKLANIAKPADLPPLIPQSYSNTEEAGPSEPAKKALPVFGKRKKIKIQLPEKRNEPENPEQEDEEQTEISEAASESPVEVPDNTNMEDEDISDSMTVKSFEKLLEERQFPPYTGKHRIAIKKILNKLKKLASQEDRMHTDWKTLSAKKHKVMKQILDISNEESSNPLLEHKITAELNRISNELNVMTSQKCKVLDEVKKMGKEINSISFEITQELENITEKIESEKEEPSGSNQEQEESDDLSLEEKERRKRKNQKRIQHRQEKTELEKQKGYEEDAAREGYTMWVPPENQAGDGRTELNDKYGY